jgi:NNP family nitrate/nitrite transporter-like MFS transporter
MSEPTNSGTTAGSGSRQPMVMLALAALRSSMNFWAWALLSPLGTRYKDPCEVLIRWFQGNKLV